MMGCAPDSPNLEDPDNPKTLSSYSVDSEGTMKRLTSILAVAALTAVFGSQVLAQSSGSANFASNTTACTDIGGLLGGGASVTSLKTTLHMSSGNGNTLVIRPSAVTGLLTNLSLSGFFGGGTKNATAQASITFQVTVTPLDNQAAPTVTPSAPVTYDDRFLQISTNLFNAISGCTVDVPCFFDFKETTLSAHSFDFVVTGLSAGNYGITVTWTPTTTAVAPNQAAACVGPVVLTATQTKIFNQNTGIVF